jgi:hypothetical protein
MRLIAAYLTLLVFSGPAWASLQIIPSSVLEDPIPSNNDFASQLGALGLDRIIQGNVKITAPGTLSFYAHASESGFTNTFRVGTYSFTESPDIPWNPAGILINVTPISVSAGMLLSDAVLNARFTTTGSGGLNAPITHAGFGIFAEETPGGSTITAPYSQLYFGYDDNGAGPDDNHDDLIVRAVFTPLAQVVPEPISLFVWSGLLAAAVLVTGGRRQRDLA